MCNFHPFVDIVKILLSVICMSECHRDCTKIVFPIRASIVYCLADQGFFRFKDIGGKKCNRHICILDSSSSVYTQLTGASL